MLNEEEVRRRYQNFLRGWAVSFLPGSHALGREMTFNCMMTFAEVLEIPMGERQKEMDRFKEEVYAEALASIEANKVPATGNLQEAAAEIGIRIVSMELSSESATKLFVARSEPEKLLAFDRWIREHKIQGLTIEVMTREG